MNADTIARQLLDGPGDIPGWEFIGAALNETPDAVGVWFHFEDDDGSVATARVVVDLVETIDGRRTKPEPHEPEKGDGGSC